MSREKFDRARVLLLDARDVFHEAATAPNEDARDERLIRADRILFEAGGLFGAAFDTRGGVSPSTETPRAEQHENTRSTIAVTTRGTVLVIDRDETGAPVAETELGADVAAARGRDLLSASRIALGVLRENASEDEEE